MVNDRLNENLISVSTVLNYSDYTGIRDGVSGDKFVLAYRTVMSVGPRRTEDLHEIRSTRTVSLASTSIPSTSPIIRATVDILQHQRRIR